MALTDATRLADFSSGVGTDGTLSANNINATGVVTATSFVGSGSGLTGVASTDNIITGTAATFTAGINVTGAAVTISNAGVNVTGVVTATSFEGDGSALTGVSGFATALSSDQTSIFNKIFKTPQTLTVGTGVSVTIESDAASGNVAFVREGIIHVGSGSTLHIDSSTAFATNVLRVF
jgi:hypothetical protein